MDAYVRKAVLRRGHSSRCHSTSIGVEVLIRPTVDTESKGGSHAAPKEEDPGSIDDLDPSEWQVGRVCASGRGIASHAVLQRLHDIVSQPKQSPLLFCNGHRFLPTAYQFMPMLQPTTGMPS